MGFLGVVEKLRDGKTARSADVNGVAPFQRILIVVQADKCVGLVKVRKLQCCGPGDGVDGVLQGIGEIVTQCVEGAGARRGGKAADANADRVNGPPAEAFDQRIAGFFHFESAFDKVFVIDRHGHRAVVAEKIGCVEHKHMQRVALDPLSAVQQPAQRSNGGGGCHAESVFQGPHGAHLIGDGADAADTGDDIGYFFNGAVSQEGFEVARGFENIQFRFDHLVVFDLEVKAAFSFDAGEQVNFVGFFPGNGVLITHDVGSLCERLRTRR